MTVVKVRNHNTHPASFFDADIPQAPTWATEASMFINGDHLTGAEGESRHFSREVAWLSWAADMPSSTEQWVDISIERPEFTYDSPVHTYLVMECNDSGLNLRTPGEVRELAQALLKSADELERVQGVQR